MTTTSPATRPTTRDGTDPTDVDAAGLASALRREIEGEVRFSDGDRHLYATDASNFRQVPIGVVLPRTVDDVVATHAVCRAFGAPITNRGGGTSLAGQSCNVAVVIDSSKYLRRITDRDYDRRRVTVEPGIVLDTMRTATQDEAQLTWGPDPSTHDRCTVGGMIGNNACGIHAFRYGRAEDNVEALEVLLYDGTRMWVGPTPDGELERLTAEDGRRGDIFRGLRDIRDRYGDLVRQRFPDIPRRVSGYNLTELLPENGFNVARALVGTEGTCATILQATLDLNDYFPERVLLVLGYPDVFHAGDHVATIRDQAEAIALEGLDDLLIEQMQQHELHTRSIDLLPEGNGWLMVEFGGDTRDEARERAEELVAMLRREPDPPTMKLYDDPRDEEVVWGAREAGLGATAHTQHGDAWPGWEDSAVPPERIGDYLRDLQGLFDRYGLTAATYGHFGDGCVHCRIDFDLASPSGVRAYRSFLEDAVDLVVGYGGSLSGEHGDGQQRGEFLDRMFGPELVGAFREFKAVWDPDGRMNPGKVVDPRRVDEDLRLGGDYRPWEPEVRFGYPDDDGSFAHAALRCVGVGKCRRDDGHGTMCPSYFATHEEMHSTRGRARLLFEMLQPDSALDGWRDEHVKEALDLCLSCKGCTVDCPVDVDMPTYKAEFLHHHYEGRLHPPAHYALGLIDVWSRIASWVPGIANAVLDAPGLGAVLKRVAGVAPQRPAPTYAGETFRDWFRRRPARDDGAPPVLYFPDTFTNYFHPEVGQATVRVLEWAGYTVTIPPRIACCGRPLYDYGFLDLADRYLDRVVDAVRPALDAGAPIVGSEPSCVAVLRDELVDMKPDDEEALRVAESTMTLAEFLLGEADVELPRLERDAVVHVHCHQKGTLGFAQDMRLLAAMGLDARELDASCCGLAGSFGFEADKYDVSVAIGELRLLPAIRETDDATLVVADGFSCRTQVEQLGGGRQPLHLAQVVELAQRTGPEGPRGAGPVEAAVLPDRDGGTGLTGRDVAALVAVGGAALGGWLLRRSRR